MITNQRAMDNSNDDDQAFEQCNVIQYSNSFFFEISKELSLKIYINFTRVDQIGQISLKEPDLRALVNMKLLQLTLSIEINIYLNSFRRTSNSDCD
jgi:hypothetical protein